MKLTKRQLKRIIREEYSRLKRKGLISEVNANELASADSAYEDGFAGYHEGRDEPGHHYKRFEDDWYAGWNDAKASPAGDYDSDPSSYETNPRWEDSQRGEPRNY